MLSPQQHSTQYMAKSLIILGLSMGCATLIESSKAIKSHFESAQKKNRIQTTATDALPARALGERHRANEADLVRACGKVPLAFEANQGQADAKVLFLSRGRAYTLFLTSNEAVLAMRKPSQTAKGRRQKAKLQSRPLSVARAQLPRTTDHGPGTTDFSLRMRLIDANPAPEVAGLQKLPGRSNYFIGNDPKNWRTNVPNYAKVRYQNLYPGIDLVYYGNPAEPGQLEYDFVVAPGADPGAIALGIEAGNVNPETRNSKFETGNSKVKSFPQIAATGDLVVQTDGGEVRLHKPVAYQLTTDHGQLTASPKFFVEAHYSLKPNGQIGIQVIGYDATRPLVIDPLLTYSTYFGGSVDEGIFGIDFDPGGNFYVAGETSSPDFPIVNAYQSTLAGNYDAFVSKFDPTGSTLLYSTYLGGSQFDHAVNVAVDAHGNAYVAGITQSPDFPTLNALQEKLRGPQDGFVTRFDPSGSQLIYSTYLGGSSFDAVNDLTIDTDGNAYVTGFTQSTDFPITPNALQKVCDRGGIPGVCNGDAFITKFNPSGSKLVYSTYLGGSSSDTGVGIAVDSKGAAYLTGQSSSKNFPVSPGAFQKTLTGFANAFVAKMNPSGDGLAYSTYLGGSFAEAGFDITRDLFGNAYVTGFTESTDFPTKGAVQSSCRIGPPPNNMCFDAFVTKLNTAGSGLAYSTYLGGTAMDLPFRIRVDALGSASVTGLTTSTDFPIANALQSVNGGGTDIFVTKFNATGSSFVYSTYLGGSGDEFGYGSNVDGAGNVWVTGSTSSLNFPTVNPYQPVYAGGPFDAYISKIALDPEQSVRVLGGEVANLERSGTLTDAQGHLLMIHLELAGRELGQGNTQGAVTQLEFFITRVEEFVQQSVLSFDKAGRLETAARDILSRIISSSR